MKGNVKFRGQKFWFSLLDLILVLPVALRQVGSSILKYSIHNIKSLYSAWLRIDSFPWVYNTTYKRVSFQFQTQRRARHSSQERHSSQQDLPGPTHRSAPTRTGKVHPISWINGEDQGTQLPQQQIECWNPRGKSGSPRSPEENLWAEVRVGNRGGILRGGGKEIPANEDCVRIGIAEFDCHRHTGVCLFLWIRLRPT